MNLGEIYTRFRLDTGDFTAKISNVIGGLKNVETGATASTQPINTLGSSIQSMALKAAAAIGLYKLADGIKSTIVESTMLSARVETLGVVMGAVGKNVGLNAQQMENYSKNVAAMGITTQVSRETVIRMVQAQMNLTDATKLARIAQDAAVIGNTNSSDALQKMIYGIQTGQVEVLKTIGINVIFETSYKKLGAQLGKNAEDLTELEKVQARANVVIEAGQRIAGTYEAAMGTVGKQINTLPRFIEEAKLKFGELFKPALMIVISELTKGLQDLNAFFERANKSGDAKLWAETIKVYMQGAVGVGLMLLDTINAINKATGKKDSETAMEAQNRLSEEYLKNQKEILHFEKLFTEEKTAWYGKASIFGWDLYAQDRKRLEILKERNAAILVEFKAIGDTGKKAIATGGEVIETAKANYNKTVELTSGQRTLQATLTADILKLKDKEFGAFAAEYAKREKIVGKDAEGIKLLSEWAALESEKIWKKTNDKILKSYEFLLDQEGEAWNAFSSESSEQYKKRNDDLLQEDIKLLDARIAHEWELVDQEGGAWNAFSAETAEQSKERLANEQKLSIEMITLNASMYEDLKGYGQEYYETQKKLIDQRAKDFRTALIEEATIIEWVAIKTMQLQTDNARTLSDYYSQISGYEDKYRQTMFHWIGKEAKLRAKLYKDDVAAAKWARDEKLKFDAKVTTDKISNIEDAIRITAGSFEQLSTLYAEDSNQRRNLHNISMAFNIAEKAAAASKAVILAVEAIATQGLGDPYTAWPRIAAMTAAMAALLSSAGIAFGFGGGGGGGGAATTATPTLPASTVLGAIGGTGSESINKGWELLQDTFDMEYRELSGIYNEMKNLNANITGLVTSLVRTGGIGAASVSTGFTPGRAESFIGGLPSSTSSLLTGGASTLLGNIGINLGNRIENWMASTLGSIIGGGIERSISGTGIAMGGASVRDLLAGGGIGAQAYTQVTEKHEGGWFGKDWYSGYKVYEELNENVSNMLDKVFKNIGATLVSLAEGLGVDTTAAMNYIFEATEINLRGMNTEEINKTLSEYFSKIGDLAVETLFGDMLKGYQEINEGLLETATRLLIDKAVVLSILDMTNQSFTGTTAQAIEFSEALIDIAGDFEKLQEAAQTYYDAFFSDAEKQTRLQSQLTEALAAMNFELPSTRAGYRDLVEGLDLTTQSGMEAYVALLDMAGAADQYYSTLEDAMEAAANSSDNLATSLGNLTLSLQEQMAQVSAAWGGPPVIGHAAGGLTRGVSIAGESGPEWIVPTYEPQKSSFLRDIGVSPEVIGKGIVNYISHGYAPQAGPTYFAGGQGGISKEENFYGKRNQITNHFNFTVVAGNKSPDQLAKEMIRPLKAEMRRLEAIGTA